MGRASTSRQLIGRYRVTLIQVVLLRPAEEQQQVPVILNLDIVTHLRTEGVCVYVCVCVSLEGLLQLPNPAYSLISLLIGQKEA